MNGLVKRGGVSPSRPAASPPGHRNPHAGLPAGAASALIAADLTPEQPRDLTIRKEILWESDTATSGEVALKEAALMRQYRSNDPAVGYNRSPKLHARHRSGGDDA